MNKLISTFINLAPEFLTVSLVRFYINFRIKKNINLTVKGLENLDKNKRPYLFVCNHLSNSDGLILNKVLEKENIIFVAGKKLQNNSMTSLGFKIVKSISISPNSSDKNTIKQIIETIRAGNSVLIFPEGTRSRDSKMIEGKKGIVLLAKLTKVPIIPIGICGTEKFMPIRENMDNEEFYDADVTVNIGKAFYLPEREADENNKVWENKSLNHVMLKIAELLPKEYRGFYR